MRRMPELGIQDRSRDNLHRASYRGAESFYLIDTWISKEYFGSLNFMKIGLDMGSTLT